MIALALIFLPVPLYVVIRGLIGLATGSTRDKR